MFITFCKMRGEKNRTIAFPALAVALALALAVAVALTLAFDRLANELLQATTMLYGLMYLTCSSTTEHKYLIRCAMGCGRLLG